VLALVVASLNNRFNRTAPFVTVCASRYARLCTNRANPLRGTGLPVKRMLDGCIAGNNKSFPDNSPSQNEEITVDKDWRIEARARREKNAVIEVKPANDGDYADEAVLRISHNGYQFTAVDVSRLEAEKVIASLKAHFGI
jgi:hypothetical protein